jgi:hypothetical protein
MRTPFRIGIMILRSMMASDASSFSTAHRVALTLSLIWPPDWALGEPAAMVHTATASIRVREILPMLASVDS